MVKYSESTVFNVGAQAVVNTVNTVGVMGAGLALEFALRYPEMESEYKTLCAERRLMTGRVSYYHEGETVIVNFPTKAHFKYPSRLPWVEQGLRHFVSTYRQEGITSVAFPKLGCSRGGLEWSEVRPLMERYLAPLDIEVIICLDELPYAEGLEAEMVRRFNEVDHDFLFRDIRLNASQRDALDNARPIRRFFELDALPGIGDTTYRKLHKACSATEEPEQISLY